MSKPVIGFIGVGLMGHGMAKNIVEAGYPLRVMAHRKRDAVDDLVSRGAVEVGSPREMAETCEMIHICVTGSPQVEASIRGPDGILSGLQPDSVVIDCSTSDPVSTLSLAAELTAAGGHLVDAPLSRTPKEAWDGTLDAMIGADPEIFARVKPVIETWAGVIVHLGDVGLGHKMKLINNFLGMGYAALYAEAGADALYAPGLRSADEVAEVCASVPLPVNVLVGNAKAGFTVPVLAQAGAARISLGSAPARQAYGGLIAFATTLRDDGQFGYGPLAGFDEIEALLKG